MTLKMRCQINVERYTCSSSVSIPFILLIDVKYSSGGQVRSVRSLTMPDFLGIFWINFKKYNITFAIKTFEQCFINA